MESFFDEAIPCPPLHKPNFCIGRYTVKFGKWYVPKGRQCTEATYCQYCIDHGCIDINNVYELTDKTINCNCDCPKIHEHPLFKPLVCPVCTYKKGGGFRLSSCGICSKCKNQTPYLQIYCPSCAWELKSCLECGSKIVDGNSYLPELKKAIEKDVKRNIINYPWEIGSVYSEEKNREILKIQKKYDKMVKLYSDKSANEIVNLLSVEISK